MNRKVAVIGAGISGLSAAWLLNRSPHITVTLYEKNSRLGGHSNTVDAVHPLDPKGAAPIPVDTGFIVYNTRTYPNLTALFDHLGVETVAGDMSFAVSLNWGGFEYAGSDLNGLFGQRRNLLRPRFWHMLADILRFYRRTRALDGDDPALADITLDACLREGRYSPLFVEGHLLPMAGAIWSTGMADIREFPLAAFVRFFNNHGLLDLSGRPVWRTVRGGSREYVARLAAPLREGIRHRAVRTVTRHAHGVQVTDAAGEAQDFDALVIATHGDEARALLGDADGREAAALAPWRYAGNRAVLHCDPGVMPLRRRVWSAWNVVSDDAQPSATGPPGVTYWMNRLQNLDPARPLFVSLNPLRPIRPADLIGEYDYTHPVFDHAALQAQKALWSLQGHRRTWYCGAHLGYGFHEDGLQSGLAVAEALGGVRRPWQVAGENDRMPGPPPPAFAMTPSAS